MAKVLILKKFEVYLRIFFLKKKDIYTRCLCEKNKELLIGIKLLNK